MHAQLDVLQEAAKTAGIHVPQLLVNTGAGALLAAVIKGGVVDDE